MRSTRSLSLVFCLVFSSVALAQSPSDAPPKKEAAGKTAPCAEHGVAKSVCTRCNPKLKAVYKSKGDWCEEHNRAESQCAVCNPDLTKKEGVKP